MWLKVALAVIMCAFVTAPRALCAGARAEAAGETGNGMLIFIGTASGGKSESRGIYSLRLDPASGKLSTPRLAAATSRPTWVSLHPNKPVLYACGEVDDADGKKTGGVSAFAIDAASGELTLLNQQPSGGLGPCYVTPDARGHVVVVANYGGGTVACLPIDSASGKLSPPTAIVQHHGTGPNAQRQDRPHAHSFVERLHAQDGGVFVSPALLSV